MSNGARWAVSIGVLAAFTGIMQASRYSQCTLTIVNATPFTVEYVLSHPTDDSRWTTVGWFTLAPGKCATIEKTVLDADPEFLIFGHTADDELVQWVYGDEIPAGQPPRLFWEGRDVVRPIISKRMEIPTNAEGTPFVQVDGAEQVGFTRVPESTDGGKAFVWVFTPHSGASGSTLSQLANVEPGNEAQAAAEAMMLAESLARQKQYETEWGHASVLPFSLGIQLDDSRYDQLGVSVVDCMATLPRDQPMPFQPGDEIISFGGRPVYGVYDIASLLIQHGTGINRGCKVPITAVVNRRGFDRPIAIQTTYWFTKAFWQTRSQASTEGGTAAWSLFNGVVFNQGSKVAAATVTGLRGFANSLTWVAKQLGSETAEYSDGPSYAELEWGIAQKDEMRRQFFEDAYAVGNFGSFFVSLPRAALKVGGRAIGNRAATRFASSRTGAIAFEVAEGVVWTINDGSPLRTTEELIEELRTVIPLAAAGGIAQGALR